MRPDPVRRRAWEVLVAVAGGAELDPALEEVQSELGETRARAFLAGLVRGTLQWQGRYDHIITHLATRRPPRRPGTLVLLRMGMHQLLAMDGVPAFAAIDQTVGLARDVGEGRAAGFINGLLRNLRRRLAAAGHGGDEGPGPEPAAAGLRALFADLEDDPAGWLAAWHSHPRWLVEAWGREYGPEAVAELCAFNNRPLPLDLCLLPGADRDAVLRDVAPWDPRPEGPAGDNSLRLDRRPARGDIARLLDEHPDLIVQDASVQEAVAWLTDGLTGAVAPGAWLDLCAAPGGKTVRLASLAGPGTPVAAMEPSAARMRLLRGTVLRTGRDRVALVGGDGLRPPWRAASLAAVLLDGPCSGTGVLRRHPEARWRLRAVDITARARRLAELAARAAELLVPGGVLMYATCSLERQENQEVVEGLLRDRPDLEPWPDDRGRWRRTWLPPVAPGDGFFAARLRRKKEVASP